MTASSGRFGDYDLVRYLAAGGMADLYLARSPRFPERDLVLKRLQPRYLDHPTVVRMFLDEGRIAQLLDHPNIARVLDVGTADGSDFLVMEYVHGHDLIAIARRSAESRLTLPRAVVAGIVAQVAAGLAHAHTLRDSDGNPLHIVHCDVSPGNVVVAFSGVAKVVDFGIARATIAVREQEGVAGKYQYMAPEQIKGLPLDGRADLFPLGTILWELTVGRRLFRGRPELVMRKVLDEPVPRPSEVVPDYPPALEQVVMRLLAKEPAERYMSAAEVAADLTAYLEHDEKDYSPLEIARFLGRLFDAAPIEQQAPADSDQEDLVRGMPEVDEISILVDEPPPEAAPPPPASTQPRRADPARSEPTAQLPADRPTGRDPRLPPPRSPSVALAAMVVILAVAMAASVAIAWLTTH